MGGANCAEGRASSQAVSEEVVHKEGMSKDDRYEDLHLYMEAVRSVGAQGRCGGSHSSLLCVVRLRFRVRRAAAGAGLPSEFVVALLPVLLFRLMLLFFKDRPVRIVLRRNTKSDMICCF